MAFSKKKIEERKEWLGQYVDGTFLDNSASNISYTDFVHKVCFGWGYFIAPLCPHAQPFRLQIVGIYIPTAQLLGCGVYSYI